MLAAERRSACVAKYIGSWIARAARARLCKDDRSGDPPLILLPKVFVHGAAWL